VETEFGFHSRETYYLNVIAHKTPFEIYFAQKCNNLRESDLDEECLPRPEEIRPTENDRK